MPRFLEVTRQTFLLQVRGKVFLVLTAASILVACVFLMLPLSTSRVRGSELFQLVVYFGGFFSLLPFATLFLASQAIAGDIEDRTSVYLFTRPISRLSLLVGKWFAVILLSGLFVTVAISSLFAVLASSPFDWMAGSGPSAKNYLVMLGAAWIAIFGYSAVGCLFAVFFRRPMLFSVLYIFLEEGASRLPPQVGIHSLTVAFPSRVLLYANMEPCRILTDILTGTVDATREQEAMLMEMAPLPAILKVALFSMVIAAWIYCRREYDSRPRE